MGQFITVTVQAGASPSVRIFDLNRSLTGMAIERYPSVEEGRRADRPPDVLARRLFDLGADRSRCTRARWRSPRRPSGGPSSSRR